ncbi:hypothetical protein M5689_002633 [Euphorbia peplus]|nr:hypothetical protein M5689_002633 [Euphorbia peplus]
MNQETNLGTRERGQSSSNPGQWVKVYRLNSDGKWDEQGTGHVTVDNLPGSEERGLFLTNEKNERSLLHRIVPDDIYKKLETTIFSWIELEDHTESALCFRDISECNNIWNQLGDVQTNLKSVFFKQNIAVASQYYRARVLATVRPRGLTRDIRPRVEIGRRRGNSDLLPLPAVRTRGRGKGFLIRPRGLGKEVVVRPRGLESGVHQLVGIGIRPGTIDFSNLPGVTPIEVETEVHEQVDIGTSQRNSDLVHPSAVRPTGLENEVHQPMETETRQLHNDLLNSPDSDLAKLRLSE